VGGLRWNPQPDGKHMVSVGCRECLHEADFSPKTYTTNPVGMAYCAETLMRMFSAHAGRLHAGHLLAHLAPLGWEHVNLTGDYVWGSPQIPS
jgi:hypothetical protein